MPIRSVATPCCQEIGLRSSLNVVYDWRGRLSSNAPVYLNAKRAKLLPPSTDQAQLLSNAKFAAACFPLFARINRTQSNTHKKSLGVM